MRPDVLALGQGPYYFATGVWPLVSMRTFEAVPGPKTDRWLVKTVGVLDAAVEAALIAAWALAALSDSHRLPSSRKAARAGSD